VTCICKLFPKLNEFSIGSKFTDDKDVVCTANGWIEVQNNYSSTMQQRALENRWTKCISVAGDYVENDKTKCAYVVVNFVRLPTS